MQLNLGCGEYRADGGWVNVDTYPGVNPDVVADLGSLPFDDASADLVYAGHTLEHNDIGELPAVLTEIRRVLKPGGRFCAVGPDLDRINPATDGALYAMAAEGGDGVGVNPRGAHRWGCTETLLLDHVRGVFPDARPVPIASLNGDPWPVVSYVRWQCAVTATRSADVVAKVVTPKQTRRPRTTHADVKSHR